MKASCHIIVTYSIVHTLESVAVEEAELPRQKINCRFVEGIRISRRVSLERKRLLLSEYRVGTSRQQK